MRKLISYYATVGIGISRTAVAVLFGSDWEKDERWKLLYYGFSFRKFAEHVSCEDSRQSLGIRDNVSVIAHVGRFHDQKNHQFFLDVAERVVAKRSDVCFLLVGDGHMRTQIETEVHSKGLRHHVVFAGLRDDVPALMLGAMDVLLFPSLWEGLGIVVVEAQAAGLRCVVSDQVPREAAVVETAVDFLPLSAGPEAWATQVVSALEQDRLDQSTALAQVLSSRFTLDRCLRELEAIYGAGA
jgi:glycosyltransferase involved in cell wall biosynthesis